MSHSNSTFGATSVFALSATLGTASYAIGNALLPWAQTPMLPAAGAVGMASLCAVYLMRQLAAEQASNVNQSMSQRLYALNSHAIVNIVDADSIITEANDQLLQLTGYASKELIGQHVSKLYAQTAQNVPQQIENSLRAGKTWQGETPLLHADGSELQTFSTVMPFTDSRGNWIGSITVRTDMTQAKEILEGHHTAQTLHELRDAVCIVNAQTEQFEYVNRTAKRNLASLGDSLMDIPLQHLAAQDSGIAEMRQACLDLKASGKTSCHMETMCLGIPSQVSIRYLEHVDGSGQYLLLVNDISARIEQERRMSEFVATVSHELRSPLTSIKGAMGLLLSKSVGEMPAKAVSMLEIAHRNADRLILIINDILDLEKMSKGQMEFCLSDVDLGDLVRETNNANATMQQRFGVNVVLKGMDGALPFRTDPNRFIQVLTNLISNAYKFSAANGTITIEVTADEEQARIAVTDEGPGIPEAEQDKLFQRFADLENSNRADKGGTGLGLNICKAIVDGLGGTIDFDSREGVGTTFFFILPRLTAADTLPQDSGETSLAS